MNSLNATLNQLPSVAEAILKEYPYIRIICFYGEMGSGKTTLIKQLCHLLEVQNLTTSPTFAIVNEYKTNQDFLVYHFDLYRLNSIAEVENIGCTDYLYSGNYCFIEWPELMEPILDEAYLRIDIDMIDADTRQFRFSLINEF